MKAVPCMTTSLRVQGLNALGVKDNPDLPPDVTKLPTQSAGVAAGLRSQCRLDQGEEPSASSEGGILEGVDYCGRRCCAYHCLGANGRVRPEPTMANEAGCLLRGRAPRNNR